MSLQSLHGSSCLAPPRKNQIQVPKFSFQEREMIEVRHLKEIRAVTRLDTEEEHLQYYLNGGVDAWYEELTNNLENNCSSSGTSVKIDDVTFPTSTVSFSREEKLAVYELYKRYFKQDSEMLDIPSAVTALRKEVADINVVSESDPSFATGPLKALAAVLSRLDACIKSHDRHKGSAFVKLTTRSPKDSYVAIEGAKEDMERLRMESDMRLSPDAHELSDVVPSKDSKTDISNGHDLDSHNLLWASFAEFLRLRQRVMSGQEAILLLASSQRVYEDIGIDLGLENTASPDALASSSFNTAQISVRSFDVRITPRTEFRGFVWNKDFVAAGQYFHQLYFPELASSTEAASALLQRISTDLQRFYNTILKPNIPEFLANTCPCFMMDLVHLPESGEVLLTEINPFDGEGCGTFPASTGLFKWDDIGSPVDEHGADLPPEQRGEGGDRAILMGKKCFELRVRTEKLITARNLKVHPELRNLSPVWKEAIYGRGGPEAYMKRGEGKGQTQSKGSAKALSSKGGGKEKLPMKGAGKLNVLAKGGSKSKDHMGTAPESQSASNEIPMTTIESSGSC